MHELRHQGVELLVTSQLAQWHSAQIAKHGIHMSLPGACFIIQIHASHTPLLDSSSGLLLCEMSSEAQRLVAPLTIRPMQVASDSHRLELTLLMSPSDYEKRTAINHAAPWHRARNNGSIMPSAKAFRSWPFVPR